MFQIAMFLLLMITLIIFSVIFIKDAFDSFENRLRLINPPQKDENFVQEEYNEYYKDEFKKLIKNIKTRSILIVILFELADTMFRIFVSRFFFISMPLSFFCVLKLILTTVEMEKKLTIYIGEDKKIVKKYLILPLLLSQACLLFFSSLIKFGLILT